MDEKQKNLPEQARPPGKDDYPCRYAGCCAGFIQKVSDRIIELLPEFLLSAMCDRLPADPGKSE